MDSKVADITLEIFGGGTFVIMSPSPNIGGDVSPLSHRDRRPCTGPSNLKTSLSCLSDKREYQPSPVYPGPMCSSLRSIFPLPKISKKQQICLSLYHAKLSASRPPSTRGSASRPYWRLRPQTPTQARALMILLTHKVYIHVEETAVVRAQRRC